MEFVLPTTLSLLIICPCCERLMPNVSTRRMNTAYTNDALNYLESCEECFDSVCEYWDDMWSEHWDNVRC